jgi:hypothetical protein
MTLPCILISLYYVRIRKTSFVKLMSQSVSWKEREIERRGHWLIRHGDSYLLWTLQCQLPSCVDHIVWLLSPSSYMCAATKPVQFPRYQQHGLMVCVSIHTTFIPTHCAHTCDPYCKPNVPTSNPNALQI